MLFYTRVDIPESEAAWVNANANGWSSLRVVAEEHAREVGAAPWHGHAGVLAAFDVLEHIEEALEHIEEALHTH